MAVLLGHREPGEDGHDDKEVVYGKHLFKHIACEEKACHLGAVVEVEVQAKGHGQEYPEDCPGAGAFQGDVLVLFVGIEVQEKGGEDDHDKDDDCFGRKAYVFHG